MGSLHSLMAGPQFMPPNPYYGTPRMTYPTHQLATTQPYVQQPQAPQVQSIYGTSPAAQYIAATQAAGAQQGVANQPPPLAPQTALAGQPGVVPNVAPPHLSQPPYQGSYAQDQYPGGMPIPGANQPRPPTGMSHSYPGASGGYPNAQNPQYGNGDHLPPRRDRKKKKKRSKIKKLLEEALYGGAGAAAGAATHRLGRDNFHSSPEAPPKGSALGFLHPNGHFVPSALDYMIEHFIHGKRERNLAPEGSKPGFLHPGGHFVPTPMENLIEHFKHTLGHERGSRQRRSETDSDDTDDSDVSSD